LCVEVYLYKVMKLFSAFITEATAASQQAKRLGLVGDGHGGWYNRATGEFEAKTVGGGLKYYNKRQKIPGKDPAQTPREKQIASPGYNDPAMNQQVQQVQQIPQEQIPQEEIPQEQMPQEEIPQEQVPQSFLPVEKTKGTLTIVFGRFNPPTVAHQELLDTAAQISSEEGSDYIIVPSRSFDSKKNPLDPDTKIFFMRKLFPDHGERIVNDPNQITIFDTLKKAHNDGYSAIRIVCGNTRVKEFENLANNYNGQLYEFEGIEVLPVGEIDADGKEVDGITSSRMRLAAAEGDLVTFRNLIPQSIPRKEIIQIFDLVRQGIGIEEIQQEGYNLWEIAPKFDLQSLRENYVSGNIFKVGTIVENLNTGLSGKIIRRGTNYLICVTEDGMMFKSWIKDVSEAYTEKHMSRKMRVSGKRNTLVGTDGYRKNAMEVMGISNIKNFINRNRKK
jgi:nicotinamide mononucleotide adenylyltransferase